jgi:hypothetical protein
VKPVERELPRLPRRPVLAVVLVAGLVTVVAGIAGFAAHDGTHGVQDLIRDAYRAVQLLVLETETKEWNVGLDIARVSSIVFVGAAVGTALYVVFSDQWTRYSERRRGERRHAHVVVAGLGDYGAHLARSFQRVGDADKGPQVVAIERDHANPHIARCREDGIVVIEGDAQHDETLALAGIRRASHLVLTCGQDATNVEIALRAATLMTGDTTLSCFAHLDSRRLWPQLMAVGLKMGSRQRYRLEFFNVFDAGARILLDVHPPFDVQGEVRASHLLVVGLDGIGESVVLHAANLWQNSEPAPRDRLRITVAGPGAQSRLDALVARFPELAAIALVHAVDAAVDAPALRRGDLLAGESFDRIYVCLEQEDEALAVGLALASRSSAATPAVVVVVPDDTVRLTKALRAGDDEIEGIEPFGLLSMTLIPELIVRGTNETIARAMHENYLRTERARGRTPGEGSMRSWDELPEDAKEQNRLFADRVGEKLLQSRCVLAPNPLIDRRTIEFAFSRDEVEPLAEAEHVAWMQHAAPDHQYKHRGWNDLPEVERDKDRDAVRALPQMLAVAGFEILRVGGAQARPRPHDAVDVVASS